jgi:transposase
MHSTIILCNDLITFEDLNGKGMADTSWRKLITIMIYKAEWACKRLELVNPRNTSQMCSDCGLIVKKNYRKEHIVVLYVVLFLIAVIMLL